MILKRNVRRIRRTAEWRRTLYGLLEASQEQRIRVKRRTEKASASWTRRSSVRRRARPDGPAAPKTPYATRGAGERPRGIDVLHSSYQNRATSGKRCKVQEGSTATWWKTNQALERGSPHIWLFYAMLKATERFLKTKIGELSILCQGKAEDAQDRSTQASPTFAKPGQTSRSQIIFKVEGFTSPTSGRRCQMRGASSSEETLRTADGAQHKTRIRIQGLVLSRYGTVRSGGPAWESPRGKSGQGAEQDDRTGKRRKGSAPTVSNDGPHQLCALAQRLLRRWRSRRQSVSEPPRSERESEISASLKRGNRVDQG